MAAGAEEAAAAERNWRRGQCGSCWRVAFCNSHRAGLAPLEPSGGARPRLGRCRLPFSDSSESDSSALSLNFSISSLISM